MIESISAPSAPGVYLMKNDSGEVIYVGKAKDIKKRVFSYFHNKKLDDKTLKLVQSVSSIDYIITYNETEALILESNLIKKFKGRYNVELKESYRYPFVKITGEDFPKIEVVRAPKKSIKNAKNVFGPFVDATGRKKMIDLVEKNFRLRTCKKLPKKACLKFYLGQCSAPCIGNIS
ncbi:MAG: GIY-YIG nuclease family protein, partial [Candidatus Diapherotrites archaeon]|nr:GIY-YIG nuclease family protein [Candidatus Diapherotrites archaeon]